MTRTHDQETLNKEVAKLKEENTMLEGVRMEYREDCVMTDKHRALTVFNVHYFFLSFPTNAGPEEKDRRAFGANPQERVLGS